MDSGRYQNAYCVPGRQVRMIRLIESPNIIAAAGQPPKQIEEYIGAAVTGTDALSIARMISPPGWSEPGQAPAFDEYTVVLRGSLYLTTPEKEVIVTAGQAVIVPAHTRVRYSTPDGAEYIAVCHPAFTENRVMRENQHDTGGPVSLAGTTETVTYETGGTGMFDEIARLWLRQRDHHAATSRFFGEEIQSRSFEDRKAEILSHNKDRSLYLILARNTENQEPVGFAISSGARGESGEIESIYVLPALRGSGIGTELMKMSLTWMDSCGCDGCRVLVGDGNENVIPFYRQFGFYPRFHHLIQKKEIP